MRRTTTTAAAAVVLIPLLVCAAGSPALAAASGDVTVTNTETVQARLSATGAFEGARVYEQLALQRSRDRHDREPRLHEGAAQPRRVRQLPGGRRQAGEHPGRRRRTPRALPEHLRQGPPAHRRDHATRSTASPCSPVRWSGRPAPSACTTRSPTSPGQTQDVTYDDGTGTMATTSAETVIPMIGQLVTVLPATFTDVRSDEAGMAGDGRGGTRMQFQMTLFPPIGSATAEFGYTAEVSHAVIPKASLTSMPVSPLEYPSFKGGAASYQAGAQKGVDLTGAGLQLDDSVLRLHDGSAQLLAGLLQLRDGASTLSTGLNDTAAPGASELAAGLNDKALPGINQLAAGLNGAAIPGAAQLAAGLNGAAVPGSAQLAAGLNGEAIPGAGRLAAALTSQIAPGADQVATGLQSAAPGAAALALGATQLDAGLAEVLTKAPALLGGLATVDSGLAKVEAGLATIYGGVDAMATAAPALHAGLQQLTTATGTSPARSSSCGQASAPRRPAARRCPRPPSVWVRRWMPTSPPAEDVGCGRRRVAERLRRRPRVPEREGRLLGGPGQAVDRRRERRAGRRAGRRGLRPGAAECGVSGAQAICPRDAKGAVVPGVLEALGAIDTGVVSLIGGLDHVKAGLGDADDTQVDGTVRGGVHSLQAGVTALNRAVATLGAGLGQLGAGAHQLNTGLGALSPD